MEKFIIGGGRKLYGATRISGAKNSILPLLAASLMTEEEVTLCDCPEISDVENMLKILRTLGVNAEREGGCITVSGRLTSNEIPAELAKAIRSSIFLLGPLLATTGSARVAYPGGCDIGLRPIDLHLRGLRELNVKIEEQAGYINCKAEAILGADIQIDKISVGATENLMMAAALAKGRTIIRNAAKEPEIVDLQNLLNEMGAKIRGAGTPVIEIDGVESLHGARHTPIPDRIVAGTLMTAVALVGGEIELQNVVFEHIAAIASKLAKSACKIRRFCDRICVSGNGRAEALDFETSPYPAFPTDMQAQVMVLCSVARGTSLIIENVFETRFKHVPELRRLGADVTVHGDVAVVRGVEGLRGAEVCSTDLRGGAALVLAGLRAEGVTTVPDVFHIDRGYERFENQLRSLGADIKRIEV
jgi:UDP-N-acetylglucosamine 1-carboxyvinyltransferase